MAVKANIALNAWSALSGGTKQMARDLKSTWKAETPLSYAFRNNNAQAKFQNTTDRENFQWDPGSISKRKVAGAAAAAYIGGDHAVRYSSGGSRTRNNEGYKDHVGIPFV